MLQSIEKRNGELVFFDRVKIEEAVFKALQYTKSEIPKSNLSRLAEVITDYVLLRLESQEKHRTREEIWIPNVEMIQDEVEKVLMSIGEHETARNYIKYRLERKEKREKAQTLEVIFDMFRTASGHQSETLKSVPLMSMNIGKLSSEVFSHATEAFWLNEVYSNVVRTAHHQQDLCIHDLGKLAFRSSSLDLENLLIQGAVKSMGGPKHFDSALMQLLTAITRLSDEVAGPICIYHFDTLLAPLIQNDELSFQQVKQCLQNFIFRLFEMAEHSIEPINLCLSMDKDLTSAYANKPVSIPLPFVQLNSYHHFQMEMDMINQCFCELLVEETHRTNPIKLQLLYQVHDHWNWETITTERILGAVLKTDAIVFSRNVELGDHDASGEGSLSSDWLNKAIEGNQLLNRQGGPMGSGEGSGVWGLVTLNLGKIGKHAENMEQFFERLEVSLAIAVEALRQKRQFLQRGLDKDLYPELKRNGRFSLFYDAIGIWGLNEGIQAFTKGEESLSTNSGQGFAEEVLEFVSDYLLLAQRQDRVLYSLDQIQESCVGGFEPLNYGSDAYALYSEDCFDQLDCQDELLKRFTGGSLFKARISGTSGNSLELKHSIQRILRHYKASYFTFHVNN